MLHNLKMLIRSRSWDFMRSRRSGLENYKRKLYEYIWNGHPVYYRPGTSDRGLVYNILIQKGKKAEYYVAQNVNPKVILDIGANIGITAIWMAKQFPDAEIYCFEPVKDNFDILLKNISNYPNIKAYQFALGDKNGVVDIFADTDITNQGGFSIFSRDSDSHNTGTEREPITQIEIRKASDALDEVGAKKADIIKIDTEGSEYDILISLPETLLSDTQWIMGELHGIKNFETLTYLDNWFTIGLNKRLKSNLFQFFALNRAISSD